MLFEAVMKFLSRLVEFKILVNWGMVHWMSVPVHLYFFVCAVNTKLGRNVPKFRILTIIDIIICIGNRMVSIKHARVSFSKIIGRVLFEVFEKFTSACLVVLSKFHEKLSYYVLIIYIKTFKTIVHCRTKLSCFVISHYTTLTAWNSEFHSTYYVALFKVKFFHFKKR
jgi:hypothetical protein